MEKVLFLEKGNKAVDNLYYYNCVDSNHNIIDYVITLNMKYAENYFRELYEDNIILIPLKITEILN